MSWHAQLQLEYTADAHRTVVRHQHTGPLRILQSLYPEGEAVCHNVLVHPPGGLVGGDTLDIQITARGNAHGLVTTPGATRFYKSGGEPALQRTHIQLHNEARLEWLPLEALCYNGCLAENRLTIELAPQAEFIGWDVTAFGLPLANQPIEFGSLRQHIEVPGLWLERGELNASDARLMQGPLGLAGNCCMASLFFITGTRLERARREQVLETARSLIEGHNLSATAGATCPNERVVVVRVLAPVVEPALQLLKGIWAAWREALWAKSASSPRIWSM